MGTLGGTKEPTGRISPTSQAGTCDGWEPVKMRSFVEVGATVYVTVPFAKTKLAAIETVLAQSKKMMSLIRDAGLKADVAITRFVVSDLNCDRIVDDAVMAFVTTLAS
jgi:hypothetical protein